jgi:preprotein translocase subunit SecE
MLKYIGLAFLALVVILAWVNWKKLQVTWLWMRKYLREVRVEMQKVTWPTRNDILGSTIVVLVAVVALTLLVSVWDQVLSWVLHVVLLGKGV